MEKKKRVIASSSSHREGKRRKYNNDHGVLPYDVLEEILLRLPVESNARFKAVSKQWRTTIESRYFTEKHLRLVEQSKINDHPKFLFVSKHEHFYVLKTLCLESASLRVFNLLYITQPHLIEISRSCNGLVCVYDKWGESIYVLNPTTKWFRQLPQPRFHIFKQKASRQHTLGKLAIIHNMPTPRLAFAKATMCDYKLVWLYNSDAGRLSERFTECEVFDFRANAWRYLDCTPTYRIFDDQSPVSTNGSVYWLTERYNGETKVIVFDLQTETFRLLPNSPASRSHPDHIDLCILDNRLYMSKRKRRTMIQEIWSLQLSSSEETWIKIYTIDLRSCSSSWSVSGRVYSKWTRKHVIRPCTPVAILKNKEILLTHRYGEGLVKYDPQTNSYSLMYNHLFYRGVPYFQSLVSHI